MIDSSTQLYAILGNPVKHSKSPAIHNALFQVHNINSAYLAFEVNDISKAVSAIKTLNIQGASVTIPFKEKIMHHLDWIDEDAMKIGAVNTIVTKNGELHGYNTDYKAAISPLKPYGIKGKNVCIIGAGGAAQAVAYGIHKEQGNMVIINRNPKKGKTLAAKFGASFLPLKNVDQIKTYDIDILINTTSIGMHPNVDQSSFPLQQLDSHMIVMDIVYNPLVTRLLSDAKNMGCAIIDGLSMFVYQGAAQFKLWTSISPDTQMMRNTIMRIENEIT